MKLISIILFMLVAGCSAIPENASILNEKVNEGINKNQIETEKIIKALCNIERAILEEQRDNIFKKTEEKYSSKHQISVSSFTIEDRRSVANKAAKVFYDIRMDINSKENELIQQTRENTQTVIKVNNEITKYLLSLQNFEFTKNSLITKISKITGIDLSQIQGLSNKLIGGL